MPRVWLRREKGTARRQPEVVESSEQAIQQAGIRSYSQAACALSARSYGYRAYRAQVKRSEYGGRWYGSYGDGETTAQSGPAAAACINMAAVVRREGARVAQQECGSAPAP